MADTTLKTNYKDDVLDTSSNERRKYQMIQNSDGTVSFVDVTNYSQVGDSFGANDINATNLAISELNSKLAIETITNNVTTGTWASFYFPYLLAGITVIKKNNRSNDIFLFPTGNIIGTSELFTTFYANDNNEALFQCFYNIENKILNIYVYNTNYQVTLDGYLVICQ